MADFCRQCLLELFGEDTKDLAGLSSKEDTEKGLGIVCLCEGCGPTCVDHEGNCMTDCLEHHSTGDK